MVGPLDRALYQELRLALVFNGGVSLAVWMGGVAKELDRFRCALARDGEELGPYRDLLDALRSELVTDVIAGTSAGGINGALLAYVVANGKSLECAGANAIRDTWREIGSIQNLLAEEGEARSAFNDEVLFRGCAKVFAQLKDAQPDLGEEASRRVRLTVTATDSYGYPLSVDEVAGRDHRLAMRFRHVERPSGDELRLSGELVAAVAQVAGPSALGTWPFPAAPSPRDLDGEAAPALLARAARTTASFPIAFGPSTLPLDWTTDALSDDPGGLTATPRMDGVLETRGGKPFNPGPGPKSSRFAIDGGLWDNSPFSAVLRAIDRTPSDRDVARRVTYIVATSDPPPKAAAQRAPGLVASVTQAVALPANVAFANDLERIEADLGQQERRREIVPRLLGEGPPDLFVLAAELYPLYRERLIEDGEVGAAPIDSLPGPEASPADWAATSGDWRWGIQPVRVAIQEARRLLREVLRELAADAAPDGGIVTSLLEVRDLLSQLAWIVDDLKDSLQGPALSDPGRVVCGQAMHDFAAAMAPLQAPLAARAAEQPPASEVLRAAIALSAGGSEMVVKRALAVEMVLHALTADRRPHKVDYGLATIRPDARWPLRASDHDGPDHRPPLAGASLHHFGGFMRASWRLHDWMWGRLDGARRLVDMLLDSGQLERLAGGANPDQAVASLAERLARVCVPSGAQPGYGLSRELAAEAYITRQIPDGEHGPGSAGAKAASPETGAELIPGWQDTLAARYALEIKAALSAASDDGLEPLRADLRRRFLLPILDEEVPELVAASAAEEGPKLDTAELLRRPDRGLRLLTRDQLGPAPGTLELLQDAESAAGNTLEALGHKVAGPGVRGLATATSKWRALWRAGRAAWRYVAHRHG